MKVCCEKHFTTFSFFLEFFSDKLNQRVCISSAKAEETANNIPLIDIYLNPNKSEDLNHVIETKTRSFKEYFRKSNMKTLYPHLFNILWYATLPCSAVPGQEQFMIKECKVANKNIDCSKIFKKVPTDSGMCCALNVENALKESVYTQLVEDMQKSNNEEPYEKDIIKASPGKRNGIRFSLDLHSNFESLGSVYDELESFKVFIGQVNEFPSMRDNGVSLQPGHQHFLSITNTILRADPNIQKIKPAKRNCYFPDEGNLELYKLYTFSNCQLECSIKSTQNELGCVPWYLPQGPNSILCDPWTARHFSELMSSISMAGQCSHCLPDCERNAFLVTPTAAKFG